MVLVSFPGSLEPLDDFFIFFFHRLGIIIPIDFHFFQRLGIVYHQPVHNGTCSGLYQQWLIAMVNLYHQH